MFDFDAGKLLIIGMVALIVIGPKDLPRVLRQVGQAVGRLRRMASEFQGQFMDAMKEADIQDIRNELAKVNQEASKLTADFDPVRDVRSELTQAVAPLEPVTPALPETAGTETAATHTVTAEAVASDPLLLDNGAPESETNGFLLPHVPDPEPGQGFEPAAISGTLAAAGLAPVAEEPVTGFEDASVEAVGRKRKIQLPKRRAGPPARVGVVRADAGRFRNVRPRRPESVEP